MSNRIGGDGPRFHRHIGGSDRAHGAGQNTQGTQQTGSSQSAGQAARTDSFTQFPRSSWQDTGALSKSFQDAFAKMTKFFEQLVSPRLELAKLPRPDATQTPTMEMRYGLAPDVKPQPEPNMVMRYGLAPDVKPQPEPNMVMRYGLAPDLKPTPQPEPNMVMRYGLAPDVKPKPDQPTMSMRYGLPPNTKP